MKNRSMYSKMYPEKKSFWAYLENITIIPMSFLKTSKLSFVRPQSMSKFSSARVKESWADRVEHAKAVEPPLPTTP